MAAAGGEGKASSGKSDSGKEDGGKRGRGRPPKRATGVNAEAEAMKKFLVDKEKGLAFKKSDKIKHSPEKSEKSEGGQDSGEVDIEGVKYTGEERAQDEIDGRAENSEKMGATTGSEHDKERDSDERLKAKDGNETCSSGTIRKGVRGNKCGGTSEAEVEWMRMMTERMNGIEVRLREVVEETCKKESAIASLEKKYRDSRELMLGMKEELVYLLESQKRDRIRIEEIEKKLDKAGVGIDGNDNWNKGTTGEGRMSDGHNKDIRLGEGGKYEASVETESSDESDKGAVGNDEHGGGNRGTDDSTEGIPNRSYLHCIPTRLSEGELERELEERKSRKKNLMVRGIRTVGKGLKDEVRNRISLV